MIYFCWKTCK